MNILHMISNWSISNHIFIWNKKSHYGSSMGKLFLWMQQHLTQATITTMISTTIIIMDFSSFPAWDDFFHRQQSEYNYKHTSNPRHHLGTSADSNWCAYKIHFDYTKSFSDKANADDYNERNGICNSDWHRLPS